MPGIYFTYTETLPTIHPNIEAFVTFRGTAVIDEEGNEVMIGKMECAVHGSACILGCFGFEPCQIPADDSPRSEDQKFLSTIKDAARKKYAQILKKVDSLN